MQVGRCQILRGERQQVLFQIVVPGSKNFNLDFASVKNFGPRIQTITLEQGDDLNLNRPLGAYNKFIL